MCQQVFRLGLCGSVEVWFSHIVRAGGQHRGCNSQTSNEELHRGSAETAPHTKTTAVCPLLHVCCCHYPCCCWWIWVGWIEFSEIWYPTKGSMSTIGERMPFEETFWSEHPYTWKRKLPWCLWLHWRLFSITGMVFLSLAKARHWLCHWSWHLSFPGLECDAGTWPSKPETMPPTSVLVVTAGHQTCP